MFDKKKFWEAIQQPPPAEWDQKDLKTIQTFLENRALLTALRCIWHAANHAPVEGLSQDYTNPYRSAALLAKHEGVVVGLKQAVGYFADLLENEEEEEEESAE